MQRLQSFCKLLEAPMLFSLSSKVQDAVVEQSVSALLQRPIKALQNEVKLLGGVKEDLQKLESSLTMIQAVVKEADNQRLMEPLKDWREKLKKVAEEADRIAKYWQDNIHRRDTYENDGSDSRFSLKKVRRLLSPASSMINHFEMRHNTGWRINELGDRLDCIAEEARELGIAISSRERKRVDNEARRQEIGKRETSSFVNKSSIVGRDDDINSVMGLLLKEGNAEVNKVPVISIVGIGGVGKTTLAQLIYHNDRAAKCFEIKIWACLADDFDFDVNSVTKSILKSADPTGRDYDSLNLEQLQKRLSEILSGKRFLLVLDDICNLDAENLDKFYPALQNGALGSQIIVTTCSDDVAWAIPNCHLHKLNGLSDQDCLTLFSRRALAHQPVEERPDLDPDIQSKITRRCKGLPSEVKKIAKAIGSKRTRSEWESVLENETEGT